MGRKRIEVTPELTWEQVIGILKSNHFYPKVEETIKKHSKEVTGVIVDCPSLILMGERVKRIQEVLAEAGATGFQVDGMKNHGYILIQNKK